MKHILTIIVALAFAVPAIAHEGCSSEAKPKHTCSDSCKDSCKAKEGHSCADACKDKCAKKSEEAK